MIVSKAALRLLVEGMGCDAFEEQVVMAATSVSTPKAVAFPFLNDTVLMDACDKIKYEHTKALEVELD